MVFEVKFAHFVLLVCKNEFGWKWSKGRRIVGKRKGKKSSESSSMSCVAKADAPGGTIEVQNSEVWRRHESLRGTKIWSVGSSSMSRAMRDQLSFSRLNWLVSLCINLNWFKYKVKWLLEELHTILGGKNALRSSRSIQHEYFSFLLPNFHYWLWILILYLFILIWVANFLI